MPLISGAYLALAVPATAGLDQPFEEAHFFIQHTVLVITPLYLVCRFQFLPLKICSIKSFLLGNWLILLLHWVFFAVIRHLLKRLKSNVDGLHISGI
jgi:hypothetical protein